jgi:hypothetical protein
MTTALWRIATPVGAGAIHPIRIAEIQTVTPLAAASALPNVHPSFMIF